MPEIFCFSFKFSPSWFLAHIFAQARREPQRGPGKHSGVAPKHFPSGENFFELFFSKWHILAYFLNFWSTARPSKRREARGS